MTLQKLSIDYLKIEAKNFCLQYSKEKIHGLYGVTDGKAVGTFIEHEFQNYLEKKYIYTKGNSAKGIDLPSEDIDVDIKVTSIRQPQSSCPFRSTRQKIYGLGYNLLVFVYDKKDYTDDGNYSILEFVSCAFVDKERTGDFQLTSSLLSILNNGANKDDIIAIFQDKNLPGDDITFNELADEVLETKPLLGYLTISNALQWRLQYGRIVGMPNSDGLYKLI
ncbi:restriction endonuclease [Candidatus Gracilibacteria bacterium]|nr:restriction endonuclease [Candidatus Gracilibacteria bacterium]